MKPTEQKRPSPQEVLRALADGKVVETRNDYHHKFNAGPPSSLEVFRGIDGWEVSLDDIIDVVNNATRIIEPEPSIPEPPLDDLVYRIPRDNSKATQEWAERQKAKDELLLEILSAVNHLLGTSSLSVGMKTSFAIMLQTYARKAFPEES